ncbi:DUF7344 domain-containing protein [Natronolimnobius baerhuensis]|uniref:DUF7344 domain-containing protein n=1 Tax=Natronolimnobius baerhuensis TaxID=253108 RepID=A0A202EAP9_9EURY|nr:hypothetical protein [Natronolimnobius baerhuensis]OVE85325.1 hypothetical protein B2G88_00400 [Natronolimnobius baerhuensis]
MTTKTTPIKSTSTDAILPTETVFTLLSDNRRRYALYYLSQTVGAVSVDTVIDELAHYERPGETPTQTLLEELTLEFHHNHRRLLVDTGVVSYDADAGTLERTRTARALDPYLTLAFDDEREY